MNSLSIHYFHHSSTEHSIAQDCFEMVAFYVFSSCANNSGVVLTSLRETEKKMKRSHPAKNFKGLTTSPLNILKDISLEVLAKLCSPLSTLSRCK